MKDIKMEQEKYSSLDEGMEYGVQKRRGIGKYIALGLAILFFSGLLAKIPFAPWLQALDFNSVMGKFGVMAHPAKNTFLGEAGTSAKAGFLFALSVIPTVMLSLGLVEVFNRYGAIDAAQRLMTPLLRPLLGLPGNTALAMITDLQSTDAGAILTKQLYDEKGVTDKELVIMTAWQFSGAAMIGSYMASASALFDSIVVPFVVPMVVILVMKFFGGILARFAVNTIYAKDFTPHGMRVSDESQSYDERTTTSAQRTPVGTPKGLTIYKGNPFDVFVQGARKGWKVATENLMPNVIMAYALTEILKQLGIMAFLGKVFGPTMSLFGVPGAGIAVLMTAWMSASSGVAVAISLLASGVISPVHATIMLPACYLAGTQLQYMGRLLGIVDLPKRYWPLCMSISVINGTISMLIMLLLLAILGIV